MDNNKLNKLEEARQFLEAIGMPKAQQTELCCLTLLAMANIKPYDSWKRAVNNWLRIHDIIAFINFYYDKNYAENSRETFRKQAIHRFRTAALIEDNGNATNSPNYRYRITDETLKILRVLESRQANKKIKHFITLHDKLINIYAARKEINMIPVKINGKNFKFSTGNHNQLQKAIIEEFAPRFAPNSKCLYIGDTVKKDLFKDTENLKKLGFDINLHDKMPDVVLYLEDENCIYFIEAVTSVGPMDANRVIELSDMTKNISAHKIFITAFLDFAAYKKFAEKLAWNTEIWIASIPDHMIHLNGDKFLKIK